MPMSMSRVFVIGGLALAGLVSGAASARAQYAPPKPPAIAESYRIEAAYGWWSADPSLIISSESLGIPGSDVDLVDDLGIVEKRLGKFNLTLKPGRKHKFRFEYLPIRYEADTVVQRSFVFNGQQYNIGLPVQTEASFKTYRFGYEYDFLFLSRGFAGVLLDVKYTDVQVELLSPIGAEFTTAVAPIPTIGFVGRGYLTPEFSVGGEVSFFRVPGNLSDRYDGRYTDYDFNATYNFTKNIGAQAGYRSVDAFYEFDRDSGALKFTGWYFGGVVRY